MSAPSLAGIGGAPVRALAIGASTAWVGTVFDEAAAPTEAALRAHDAVAGAALERATPLPARFGQRFATDDDCRRALLRREDAIAARLAEVDGCVEMRVLLVPAPVAEGAPPAAVAAPASGRAYLEGVRARLHDARALHERGGALRRALAPLVALVRGEALSVRPGTGAPVAVAHLVRRADVPAWRAAVERLLPALREDGARIAVAGPVAPYTFAELADVGSDA